MKYATNNIHSIILLACAGLMVPCLSIAFVGWAGMQLSLWEPVRPIRDLGWVCLLLLVMTIAPAVVSVYLGFLLEPTKAADPA